MRYVSDLRIGRINPRHFKFGLDVQQKKYNLAEFVREQQPELCSPPTPNKCSLVRAAQYVIEELLGREQV